MFMNKKTERILFEIIGTIASFLTGVTLAFATVGKPMPIFFIPFVGCLALSILSYRRIKILKKEFEIELDKLGIEKEEQFVWKKARKKPIIIEFREVKRKEIINTREGQQTAFPNQDFIIRGIEGEEYPIKKDIFEKTYEVIENAKK